MLARLGPRRRPIVVDASLATAIGAAERAAQQQASPAAVLALDPQLYPPAGSRTVVRTDQQLVAGAGTVAPLPACTVVVDRGHELVIRQLTLFVDTPLLDTRATWTVLANGVPLAGLAGLTMLFRAAASATVTFDTLRAVVGEGTRIEVQVTNVDGVGRVFGAQLVGWTTPRAALGTAAAGSAAHA